MPTTRRHLLVSGAASLAATVIAVRGQAGASTSRSSSSLSRTPAPMYGLIGKFTATPGQRDTLIDILLDGTAEMPGCLSYIVARDPQDADGLWVTEVWDSEASHKASLALPAVQAAIAKGRPLIAGVSHRTVTEPVGGAGLPRR